MTDIELLEKMNITEENIKNWLSAIDVNEDMVNNIKDSLTKKYKIKDKIREYSKDDKNKIFEIIDICLELLKEK